ncbi:pleckstrin homology domain-containing family H member 3 isoform X1 [Lepisosteus oculatus]|uniref:pleckstrin homology domain-containing family H member 3 isoform X1 n=1 Tax=Lepisosteus oculatus TaxID=7918 RepID=UPI003719725F
MPLQGVGWFLCCRQGFKLLGREYGEKEDEESFELRTKDEPTCNGRSPLEVTLTQPTHTANGPSSLSEVPEEMRSLIIERGKAGLEEDPELVVKGWLYREVRGGWIWQKRHWFVLTPDSLDYYTSNDQTAKRLGALVLTSLCSVIWPDKQTYKETGYWSITVYGRKHCYRLFTKHFNEAVHWACAIQKVIESKAPVETPTQLLIRDIEENKFNPEVVEHIYNHNPILKYTQSPLYAPLLPFPYGSLDHTSGHTGKGYTTLRDEAVKVFNSLQQLESARDPVPLIQGVLQTCLDLHPLRDEVYCQLVKQTSGVPAPSTAAHLRYWQLLTCMSCTFLPGLPVRKYLRFHLKRVQSQCPDTEMDNYAAFISEALEKTKGRECVPSLEEIQVLLNRQEMLCTVYYPGHSSCQLPITSHTTADEVVKKISEQLGLQHSQNTFALFEQNAHWERAVGGSTIIADILTRFENLFAKDPSSEGQWRLCFKLYCFLDTDGISTDSIEHLFLFEQCHDMVIRGQLPASEEDLQSLAALRLQALNGDFGTHTPLPSLDELFPGRVVEARALASLRNPQPPSAPPPPAPPAGCGQRFPAGLLSGALWSHTAAAAHKQRAEEGLRLRGRLKEEAAAVMGAIVERWKGLQGCSPQECMTAYLNIAKQWPGFGCTLYEVDFYISSTGSFSQKLWLGVAAKSVALYRQGESEPLESFPYGQICSYGVTDNNTFKITAGDRDLLFETSKLNEIAQLMNAYISAARQHQSQKSRTERESFCLSLPVLELPSQLI